MFDTIHVHIINYIVMLSIRSILVLERHDTITVLPRRNCRCFDPLAVASSHEFEDAGSLHLLPTTK